MGAQCYNVRVEITTPILKSKYHTQGVRAHAFVKVKSFYADGCNWRTIQIYINIYIYLHTKLRICWNYVAY